MVIDPKAVERALPDSVLAVFYQPWGGDDARAESEAVHARFLRDYPTLSAARFPLLEYTLDRGPAFRCVTC